MLCPIRYGWPASYRCRCTVAAPLPAEGALMQGRRIKAGTKQREVK